jgi:hypothetical protein
MTVQAPSLLLCVSGLVELGQDPDGRNGLGLIEPAYEPRGSAKVPTVWRG